MFLLIRHAKSTHNLKGIFAGSRLNTKLTSLGRIETTALAKEIADKYHFDKIICSSLFRTYQTSLIFKKFQIKKYHTKFPIIKTNLLDEVDVGLITGMTPETAFKKFPLDFKNVRSNNIQDWNFTKGESFIVLNERYLKLIDFLRTYKDENVLLVGHAMFNQFILKKIIKTKNFQFDHNFYLELPIFKENNEK
jgi:broad specificity phosphatase PhoE